MGTSYYWSPNPSRCRTCGHDPGEEIHIGKSATGWVFALHITDTIPTLDAWKLLWLSGTIRDEYGEAYTAVQMLRIIAERSHPETLKRNSEEDGYTQFVGQGEGTWDMFRGDFS